MIDYICVKSDKLNRKKINYVNDLKTNRLKFKLKEICLKMI